MQFCALQSMLLKEEASAIVLLVVLLLRFSKLSQQVSSACFAEFPPTVMWSRLQ
jgi:hypothetical protein